MPSELTILRVAVVALLLLFLLVLARRRSARRDAVTRSRAVIAGKVHEQVTPYLPGFEWNPKDARFLGSPVDFVVFDGLDAGGDVLVIFVEVKTGRAGLTSRERRVRDAIQAGRLEWRELHAEPRRGSSHASPPRRARAGSDLE
jgi:predicted Holliday junction resolvase-like endonuclease